MTQSLSLPDWLAGPRLPETLDVVVVGSGYGGAVAARRLAERGHHVVVLERGAEYLPGDFPNDVGQLPLFQRGTGPRGPMGSPTALFDWHVGAGATALVANGLGGGSLINAGVMMLPEPEVFAQPAWPAELRLDARRPGDRLDDAFREAARQLDGTPFGPTPAPKPMPPELPKSAALRRLGEAMREQRATRHDPIRIDPATVTIDLEKCTRCGDCFTGCNVPGAKRTLGSTYLDGAVKAGAQLVTRALVYAIEPHPDGGWTLRVLDTVLSTRYHGPRENGLAKAERLHGVRLHAREVVLAAGSLGSTELLLRSREEAGPRFPLSPVLGSRFSANGDGLSMSIDEAVPVDSIGHGAETLADKPPVGPTITTVLDLRGRPALEERIVVQDCAVPGALRRVMQEGLATVWALQHLGSRWRTPRHAQGSGASDPLAASPRLARHTQVLLAMGHDRSAGRVVWVPEMNAAVPFWPEPDEVSSLQRQETVFEAARALGGLPLPGPWWRALPDSATEVMSGPKPDPMLLTVHPLGGCPMGDEFEHSVVNHLGQVWSGPQQVHPGLSVLDGAIVPTALGCNPLWTITALAERAMALRDAAGQPPAAAPATGEPRTPQPLERTAVPPTALVLRERLTLRALPLPRGLRRALRHATADADLELALRHPDAERLWDFDRRHRIDDVQGRLRLAVPASPGKDAAGPPERMLSYEVTGGSMELLAPERWWQGLAWPLLALLLVNWRVGPLAGLLAGLLVSLGPFVRTVLTWFILRGWRELCSNFREQGLAGLWRRVRQGGGLIAMWRHAGEQRHVRYDLQLERCNATGGLIAPSALRVDGDKTLRYAATWSELLRHIVRRLAHGPLRVRPGDLRETWFEQLTKPWLSVRERGALGWPSWAGWPGRGGRSRFDFDIRALLQKAPMQIEHGTDSSAGMLALLAYPMLIGRVAMLTRLLDLRLPDYSGRVVVDAPTDDDLALRGGPAKAAANVVPDRYTLRVPRGDSSNDDGSESIALVELQLLRYRRRNETGQVARCGIENGHWHDIPVRRARCVLVLHAFGMSSLAFTFKQTAANFAEHLYAEGYEVWLLDSRISPRVADGYRPSTLDQHGLRDVPGAVDFVLNTLVKELGAGDRLQIGLFAHCMGAGGALIALLGGRLSYDIAAGGLDVKEPHARQLPKLAALVCSQVHPYMVGSRNTQAKTWVASFLRDLAGRTLLPLAVRGPVHSLLDATVDRVFASLPVPEGERCPDEGSARRRHDDDCATCRRIRFFDGQLFGHRQLNRETHEALPRLFGDSNMRLFAHAGRVVEYERLVSEDGFNAYVTDSNIRRYLGLPLRFVHGAENDLFDRESATRSAMELERLHPGWARRYGTASHGLADVIDDYGHLDVLIGQHAPEQTYRRLSALFARALQPGPALPDGQAARGPGLQVVRLPLAGPWMGPAERQADGTLWWPVAFLVDDRQAEGGGFHERAAAHLVGRDADGRAIDRWFLLEIERVDAPLVAIDGHRLPEGANDDPGGPSHGALRIASGLVSVAQGVQAVAIECMSANPAFGRPADHEPDTLAAGVAAVRLEPRHGRDWRPLSGSLDLPSDVLARPEAAVAKAPAVDAPETPRPKPIEHLPSSKNLLDALRRGLADTLAFERERRQVAEQPFPPTVSTARLEPLDPERRWVHPPPVPPAEPTDTGLRVAALTCAYPGTPWDRDRASASHARLYARCTAHGAPSFGFLLGDQIYADATAGLVDPLSPVERYGRRHEQAWRASAWRGHGLRTLMQRLPLVMTPDDHEFANAYPDGAPLYRGDEPVGSLLPRRGEERESPREAVQRGHAESVLEQFQLSIAPPSAIKEGWHAFEAGGVRFFVADTRRFRTRADRAGAGMRILSTAARVALQAWIEAGADSTALHCFVSGSVVLPGLVPGSEPGQYAPTDTWQAAPVERAWLLELLTTHLQGRFVLLSGDYHVSWSGPVLLDGQVVGAAVVAPPVYAPLPYANAMPSSVWHGESLALATGTLTLGDIAAARGSGYGLLTMRRDAQANSWHVGLETELFDMERGGTWETVDWPTVVLS